MRFLKFVGMLVVGLPMAFLMAIADAPMKEGESYGTRAKEFLKALPKMLMMAWEMYKKEVK